MADRQAILTIYNNHYESCGEPPKLDNAIGGMYIGYFQNEYGEQWLFTYDHATDTGILRGGDVNWDKRYIVMNGNVPELVLDSGEQQWLTSCWNAATAFRTTRRRGSA